MQNEPLEWLFLRTIDECINITFILHVYEERYLDPLSPEHLKICFLEYCIS